MKKLKKPLSIILAVIMAISVCAVGFSAFAADETVDKQIEAAGELTPELQGAFNALTDAQKDALKPQNQAKIYQLAFEKAKVKDEATGITLKAVALQNKILEMLPPTEAFKEAQAMAKTLRGFAGITIDGVEYPAEVIGKIAASTSFRTDIKGVKSEDNTQTFPYVVKADEQKEIAAKIIDRFNAMTDAQKYIVMRTTQAAANSTASESNGPVAHYAYIERTSVVDSIAYLYAAKIIDLAFNLNKANGVAADQMEKKILSDVKLPSFEGFELDTMFAEFNKLRDAYEAYGQSDVRADKMKYLDAYNAYNENVPYGEGYTLFFEKYSKTISYRDGKAATLKDVLTKDLLARGVAISDQLAYEDFSELLAKTELKEPSEKYNKVIIEVRDAYNALSGDAKNKLTAEENEKYNKLLELGYLVKLKNEHKDFTSETAQSEMPQVLDEVINETLLNNIGYLINDGVIGNVMPGENLQSVLANAFFTNENVTAIAKKIMPLLHSTVVDLAEQFAPDYAGILPGFLPFTPTKVAGFLKDEQFVNAGTSDTLKKIMVAKDPEKPDNLTNVAGQIGGWEYLENVNWGVADGDYDAFITAVLSLLNGVTTLNPMGFADIGGAIRGLLDGMLLDTDYAPTNINYVPGGWNTLVIPLFEALGVDSMQMMDSLTYSKQVRDNGSKIVDYVKPILDVLWYQVVPKLLADPVDYLASNLPNLLYHLEDGCILNGLDKVLNNNLDLLGNIIELKPAILGLLADMNGGVAPEKLDFALLQKILTPVLEGVGISLDDIMKIAHMGKLTTVKTNRIDIVDGTTGRVVADKESVINQLGNIISGLLLPLDLGNGMKLDFNVNKNFVKQEMPKYPHNGKMDKKVMNAMITGLDGLLSGFVNLNDVINGLLTNVNAATAVESIYGALDGALGSLISSLGVDIDIALFTPKAVADTLTEDKYKDVKAALQVSSWNDVALVVKNGDAVYSCVDMGFKDGDRDGFIASLAACLRPLVGFLCESGLITNRTVDGETVYGLYETLIIPAFEALGLTPATGSAEYTDNYNKLSKSDEGRAYDYALKTILDPILDLVNQVTAAPVATLMKLLPNLAYAIQYNPTLAFLGNLLDSMGDLTGILNGLVQGIATGEDAAGNPVYGLKNLELPAIDLNALASCGKVTDKDSKSALHKTYTTVVADSADTFVTVFYYLHEAINYKENLNTIKDLLAGIEGIDPSISTMIGTILNDVFTQSREEALCALGTLLASDVWECPNGAGNNGDSTPSTGDSSIPAAVVLLMMVSAGGAILLLKKKKPVAVK